uniref:Uncharacterized protein n=1 Tax=Romanomermis culicivorax TaxID=13658 RepID=A0A915K7I3_ROMCU
MVENLLIEEGQIASWDGKTLISTLALSGSGQALGNVLTGAEQELEHIIIGTHEGLKQGLNNLLKGPLQML